jgi:hypothetical protein
MSDEGVAKKAGVAGLGLAALVGVLARGADDCGRAGVRLGANAGDDVARVALPAGALADDLGRGAGRVPGRVPVGAVDDVTGAAARGKVPGALADDGVRLGGAAAGLGDDAVRAGGAGTTLEEALLEAGMNITLEVLPIGPDDDPEERPVQPARPPSSAGRIRPLYLGNPGALAPTRLPALAQLPTNLRVRTESSSDATEFLGVVGATTGMHAPMTVLGRATPDRDALVLPSSGVTVRVLDVLRGCYEHGSPCLVLACDHDAPSACDDAAASAWKSAAVKLPGVTTGNVTTAVLSGFGVVMATLVRGVLEARAADPAAGGAFLARLDRNEDGWRIVRAAGSASASASER